MSSDKIYMNVESDFILQLNPPEGYKGDFRVSITSTGKGNETIEVSRTDGVLKGCKEKNGHLYVVIRNGQFQPGYLRVKTYLWIENEWGEVLQQMVPNWENILITQEGMNNTDAAEMSVDIVAPYIKSAIESEIVSNKDYGDISGAVPKE